MIGLGAGPRQEMRSDQRSTLAEVPRVRSRAEQRASNRDPSARLRSTQYLGSGKRVRGLRSVCAERGARRSGTAPLADLRRARGQVHRSRQPRAGCLPGCPGDRVRIGVDHRRSWLRPLSGVALPAPVRACVTHHRRPQRERAIGSAPIRPPPQEAAVPITTALEQRLFALWSLSPVTHDDPARGLPRPLHRPGAHQRRADGGRRSGCQSPCAARRVHRA